MKTKYAFQEMKENMARAITKDAGISTKVSIEIANFLRGKSSAEAKTILGRVLKKTQAIPYKRFNDGVGHRKGAGVAAGRFPQKASEAFVTIIKQCEANALAKGLSTDLMIVHLVAQQGSNTFRHGRQRRRQFKRTHLEIVLEEMEPVKKAVKKAPVKKTTEAKADVKPQAKAQETESVKKAVKEEKPEVVKSDAKAETKTTTSKPKSSEDEAQSKKQTSEEQK